MSQFGGVNNVFKNQSMYGNGVGGYFNKFMKYIIPIAEKNVQNGLKTIGNEALNSTLNVAKDVLKGRNIKEAAEEYSNFAFDNLKRKAEASINSRESEEPQIASGLKKGIKRSKKIKNKKKKLYTDYLS